MIEYSHVGFAPARRRLRHDLLRPHRPPRGARLRRPDAAARRHDPRVPRPLHAGAPPRRRDPRHLLALRRRNVDRGLLDRVHPLAAVRNPVRSEADAFRFLLLTVGCFALIVAAAAVATWIGVVVFAVLTAVAAAWWVRSRRDEAPLRSRGGPAGGRAPHPRRGERDRRRRPRASRRSPSEPTGSTRRCSSSVPRSTAAAPLGLGRRRCPRRRAAAVGRDSRAPGVCGRRGARRGRRRRPAPGDRRRGADVRRRRDHHLHPSARPLELARARRRRRREGALRRADQARRRRPRGRARATSRRPTTRSRRRPRSRRPRACP